MKKWDISAGLLRGVTLAVICLYALLMWSCRGTKQFTDNILHVHDSVMEKVTVTPISVKVPQSQADLRLNIKDVATLTPGASFTDKKGQASVKVERHDSIIYITATCDSLQLLVESQAREIYHLRSQLEKQHTEIEKPLSQWETLKNNTFYIVVGMFIMLVIILIKKIWKNKIKRLNL